MYPFKALFVIVKSWLFVKLSQFKQSKKMYKQSSTEMSARKNICPFCLKKTRRILKLFISAILPHCPFWTFKSCWRNSCITAKAGLSLKCVLSDLLIYDIFLIFLMLKTNNNLLNCYVYIFAKLRVKVKIFFKKIYVFY